MLLTASIPLSFLSKTDKEINDIIVVGRALSRKFGQLKQAEYELKLEEFLNS